jgi:predicted dehydrogenase
MDKVKIAVVGVGSLGSRHAKIYSEMPDVELLGVVDADFARAQSVAAACRTRAVKTVDELPDALEGVSVVVPTRQHFSVAHRLLKRGFHLMVEKPFTETVRQASLLLRHAEKNGILIQVGHVERFNPAVLVLEKILREPRYIECHRQAPFQPRGTDVSVILDLMIHDLDIILHLVASEVESITALGTPILTEHDDIANARIVFKNGCVASVSASRVSPERMRKIRVYQDDAYISLDYMAQKIKVLRREKGAIVTEQIPVSPGEPLRMELRSFVESVKLGGIPQVPAEHGLEALKVAMEIIEDVNKYRRRLADLQAKSKEEWKESLGG